jgi:hypothetical protein
MPASPVYHPLGPPTISGTSITVDTMLNQPTRITRMISDLSLQRFVADRIFASAGGVTGGAVVYDKVTANELYSSRDVERVAPGQEFPEIVGDRLVPSVAEVEKWGGKVYVTDEARQRNNSAAFTNLIRQLSNTIVRKVNARAIATLEAAITAGSRTFVGRNWSTATDVGTTPSTRQNLPMRDFAEAARQAEVTELGINYDLWILNPNQYADLVILYGAAGLRDLLSELGISIYVSNRVTAGTAYVVASQQVGELRVEKALGTETWREPNRERTATQASVRPVMFVSNEFAILKATGLAG